MLVLCTVSDSDPRRRRTIDTLGAFGNVLRLASCRDLLPTLRRRYVSAVITGIRDDTGVPIVPTLVAVRSEFPGVTVLTVCDLSPSSIPWLVPLARAGVDELLPIELGARRHELRDALRRAFEKRGEDQALARLVPLTPKRLRPYIMYCFAHAHGTLTVEAVSRALCVDRSTLAAWLSTAGLPAAGEVIALARAYNAACLLDLATWTVAQVATACGFGGGAGLSNFLYRHLKLWPGELRQAGGAKYVLDVAALAISRSARTSALPAVRQDARTAADTVLETARP